MGNQLPVWSSVTTKRQSQSKSQGQVPVSRHSLKDMTESKGLETTVCSAALSGPHSSMALHLQPLPCRLTVTFRPPRGWLSQSRKHLHTRSKLSLWPMRAATQQHEASERTGRLVGHGEDGRVRGIAGAMAERLGQSHQTWGYHSCPATPSQPCNKVLFARASRACVRACITGMSESRRSSRVGVSAWHGGMALSAAGSWHKRPTAQGIEHLDEGDICQCPAAPESQSGNKLGVNVQLLQATMWTLSHPPALSVVRRMLATLPKPPGMSTSIRGWIGLKGPSCHMQDGTC